MRVEDWCGEYQGVPTTPPEPTGPCPQCGRGICVGCAPYPSPTPEPGCAKCNGSGIVRDVSGTMGTNCDHATPTDEQVRELRKRCAAEALPSRRTLDTIQCLDALLAERAGRRDVPRRCSECGLVPKGEYDDMHAIYCALCFERELARRTEAKPVDDAALVEEADIAAASLDKGFGDWWNRGFGKGYLAAARKYAGKK